MPKLRPPRDKSGRCRKACQKLADDLGFSIDEIWKQFEFLALALEFEQNLPRGTAEPAAMRNVVAMFDKRGQDPS